MCHRTGNARLPVVRIGTQELLATVVIRQFEHTAESAFPSYHTFVIVRSHNFIGPPAGCDLCSQHILGTGFRIERIGNVVGKRQTGLFGMSKSRFEYFFAHQLSVYIDFVHSQR